jgi:hypothetical protein
MIQVAGWAFNRCALEEQGVAVAGNTGITHWWSGLHLHDSPGLGLPSFQNSANHFGCEGDRSLIELQLLLSSYFDSFGAGKAMAAPGSIGGIFPDR